MSSFETRASVLAIGTELSSGQVVNRNASWISERLEELGAEVVLHETVPDDRALIREALDRCASIGSLVFVTGGLGPTTDDFTREVVADWLGRALVYHEASWSRIEERLTAFGVPVSESNRQQCYFPEGARVLINEQGTANAFAAERAPNLLWVLPGPPREIEAVWGREIQGELTALLPARPARELLTWQCIGKSEAALGELTESALQGSGLSIGYRAHRPFVEIKVWVPRDELEARRPWLDRLEAAIGPWVATRQGEDLAERFLKRLAGTPTRVEDRATGGVLIERLAGTLRRNEALASARVELEVGFGTPHKLPEAREREAGNLMIFRVLPGAAPGEWRLEMHRNSKVREQTFQSPFSKIGVIDRNRALIAELALKAGAQWLAEAAD